MEHHWAESAAEQGFGWLVPVRKLSVLGVTEQADVDWLLPKLTPHPWKTYTDPLRLTGAVDDVPAAFVECVSWMRVFAGQADRARDRGWPVHELETGHEAMVTAPGSWPGCCSRSPAECRPAHRDGSLTWSSWSGRRTGCRPTPPPSGGRSCGAAERARAMELRAAGRAEAAVAGARPQRDDRVCTRPTTRPRCTTR